MSVKIRRIPHLWVAIVVAAGLSLAAARPLPAAEALGAKSIADLVNAAKNETTLRAQWGADTLDGGPGLQKIVAAMNKKYGLNVQPSFTPGANMQGMMSKITRELLAGQPASSDVYFGNSQAMFQANEHKPLMAVDWRALVERNDRHTFAGAVRVDDLPGQLPGLLDLTGRREAERAVDGDHRHRCLDRSEVRCVQELREGQHADP